MSTGRTVLFGLLLAGSVLADADKLPRQNFGPRPPTDEPVVVSWLHQPGNAYQAETNLPPTLRRVALLPVTVSGEGDLAENAQKTLAPVLVTELGKRAAFELVTVLPERLANWSGQASWMADEKLPRDLLARICEETGADAVLFAHVSQYRPYRPMVVGWKLMLVDKAGAQIWWAVDEVFDAGEAKVARSARQYGAAHVRVETSAGAADAMLLSPSRFGQYATAAVLATLPDR